MPTSRAQIVSSKAHGKTYRMMYFKVGLIDGMEKKKTKAMIDESWVIAEEIEARIKVNLIKFLAD